MPKLGEKVECLNCHKFFIATRTRSKYCSDTCQHRDWVNNNKEHDKEQHRKDSKKNRAYLRIYGLGLKDYNKMFAKQEGHCAICGIHQSELKIALHIDHNHETGRNRGLLCHQCNIGLGVFEDNAERLERAAEYLRRV